MANLYNFNSPPYTYVSTLPNSSKKHLKSLTAYSTSLLPPVSRQECILNCGFPKSTVLKNQSTYTLKKSPQSKFRRKHRSNRTPTRRIIPNNKPLKWDFLRSSSNFIHQHHSRRIGCVSRIGVDLGG